MSAKSKRENSGKLWTDEATTDLLLKAQMGMPIAEIADLHKRTQTAIKLKLFDSMVKYAQDSGMDDEAVCKLFHVSLNEYQKHIATQNGPAMQLVLLREIRDLLQVVVSKMK